MIQLNLDDIKAVLDRANDDADRVSVYEYREALNAVYRTAMRILSEKMALEAERIELRGTVANLSTSLDCSSERHIWELEDLRTERDELKTRLAHAEADAEQAVHNEAFNERMKIVAWMRNRVVHKTNASMQTLDELVSICDAIHRGEHE